MRSERTILHLDRMLEAASLIKSYVEGMKEREFLAEKKTQQAVALNLIVIGESVSRIGQDDPDFFTRYPELPWRQMTGMRNRIAHGYFDLDMHVVWETAQNFVPELENRLPAIRAAAAGGPQHP